MRQAEIVSVGTELLLGQILDTHAPTMARILAECGIGCRRRTTVGDNFDRLVETLKEALSRADVVVTIGGLGPTMDDLTREGIAAALGDALVREDSYATELREWFAARNFPFAESNAKQADRPESGQFIPNPNGTAPGLLCEKNGKVVIAMPGPKGEFDPMANGYVRNYLERLGGGVIHSRVLRVIGIGESQAEKMVAHLMESENPTVAPYAHTGEVHLRVTAHAATKVEADALIDPMHEKIADILGSNLFGVDNTSLEQSVIDSFVRKGATLAVAESMTGGQLASRLTAAHGASKALIGGVVTYSIAAKESLLGISPGLLAQFGPVSSECAEAMAIACREKLGTTYGVSITGNAGPSSDVDGKPVGLVYIGLSGSNGTVVREEKYRGVREDVQRRATQTALAWLRTEIAE